jgi:hypothetical protein
LNASASVEHRRQERIVPAAIEDLSIDSGENGIEFFVFQVLHRAITRSFEWNAEDSLAVLDPLRTGRSDVSKKTVDRRKANVAR